MVPPYDPTKFPNRWWKLGANSPVRTLTAHIGKDTYTHIHYDSEQARVITVREAARLQSFPDGFKFAGTMNPAFRQIGNAVPPLLARAIARCMLGSLRAAVFRAEAAE
jgi:DNA (cytosine-5)-methyltransferase 1